MTEFILPPPHPSVKESDPRRADSYDQSVSQNHMPRRQEGCWTGLVLAVAATCVFATLLVRLKFHLIEQLEKDGA